MSEDPVKDSKESFSQFLARVFDQLSITAWLPAMMVVATALLLSQLAKARGSLTDAFDSIGRIGVAGLVFLVAAVILTTMFTQAFEFAAIRALEGYWSPMGLRGLLSRRRRQKYVDLRESLDTRRRSVAEKAVESAKGDLRLKHGIGSARYDALVSIVAVVKVPDATTDDDLDYVEDKLLPIWKASANPQLIAELAAVDRLLGDFPSRPHRILPTKLGNVMRSAEDRLGVPPEQRVENFVLHRLDGLPLTIARNYREQRRRLDLYCGLVFVFMVALWPAAGVTLSFRRTAEAISVGVSVVGMLALLAVVSYRAAIASARKLGYALDAIKAFEHRQSQQSTGSPP